jgi:hypothetical protein
MSAGVVYLIGLVIGLVVTDAALPTKVLVAATWPLGLVAFVVTITGLLIVAMIAFPLVGVGIAACVAALLWLLTY